MSALMERETLFFSVSMSMILASTSWPTVRTLLMLVTLSVEIWEMWIRPSTPGMICANAPNSVMLTIVALITSPIWYSSTNFVQGFSSGSLAERETLFFSGSKDLTITVILSPSLTMSLGWPTLFQVSSLVLTRPSTGPMSTNTP